jgi:hypothetical protein
MLLSHVFIATKQIKIYSRNFNQTMFLVSCLEQNDKLFNLINEYLQKAHAPTHCTYKMKVLDVFEINKQIEHDRFKDVGNKYL